MSVNLKCIGAGLAMSAATLMMTGCKNMHASAADNVVGDVVCYGVNQCRGQGSCATANNACKGQNACAGQGLKKAASKQECEAKGGTVHVS